MSDGKAKANTNADQLRQLTAQVERLDAELVALRRDYATFKTMFSKEFQSTCKHCGRIVRGNKCPQCGKPHHG